MVVSVVAIAGLLPILFTAGAFFGPALFLVLAAFCVGVVIFYSACLCWCFRYPLDSRAPLGWFAVPGCIVAVIALVCAHQLSVRAFGAPDYVHDLISGAL